MRTITRTVGHALSLLTISLLLCSGSVRAADDPGSALPLTPAAWGVLSSPAACVIFREYQKTKIGFYVVLITARTHSELQVLETTNGYAMERATWIEDEPTMQDLQRRAMHDHVRYVKIPDKYSRAELEAARDLCWQEDVSG